MRIGPSPPPPPTLGVEFEMHPRRARTPEHDQGIGAEWQLRALLGQQVGRWQVCRRDERNDGYRRWAVERDSSTPWMLEVVTPVLRSDADVAALGALSAAWAERLEMTVGPRCGLHIHVGAAGLAGHQVLALVTMFWQQQDTIMQACGTYARRVSWCEPLRRPALERLFDVAAPIGDDFADAAPKFSALNLANLARWPAPGKRTIEFRCFNGSLDADVYQHWIALVRALWAAARATPSPPTRDALDRREDWARFARRIALPPATADFVAQRYAHHAAARAAAAVGAARPGAVPPPSPPRRRGEEAAGLQHPPDYFKARTIARCAWLQPPPAPGRWPPAAAHRRAPWAPEPAACRRGAQAGPPPAAPATGRREARSGPPPAAPVANGAALDGDLRALILPAASTHLGAPAATATCPLGMAVSGHAAPVGRPPGARAPIGSGPPPFGLGCLSLGSP